MAFHIQQQCLKENEEIKVKYPYMEHEQHLFSKQVTLAPRRRDAIKRGIYYIWLHILPSQLCFKSCTQTTTFRSTKLNTYVNERFDHFNRPPINQTPAHTPEHRAHADLHAYWKRTFSRPVKAVSCNSWKLHPLPKTIAPKQNLFIASIVNEMDTQ